MERRCGRSSSSAILARVHHSRQRKRRSERNQNLKNRTQSRCTVNTRAQIVSKPVAMHDAGGRQRRPRDDSQGNETLGDRACFFLGASTHTHAHPGHEIGSGYTSHCTNVCQSIAMATGAPIRNTSRCQRFCNGAKGSPDDLKGPGGSPGLSVHREHPHAPCATMNQAFQPCPDVVARFPNFCTFPPLRWSCVCVSRL